MHVLVSLLLIFIVLIQGGKGAEMGAAFGGGSSQTLFGGRGAATFLGKMTTVVAVVFMLTSLFLAFASFRGASVIKPSAPVKETQAPGAVGPGGQLPPPGEALPLEQEPAEPQGPPGEPGN